MSRVSYDTLQHRQAAKRAVRSRMPNSCDQEVNQVPKGCKMHSCCDQNDKARESVVNGSPCIIYRGGRGPGGVHVQRVNPPGYAPDY